MHLCQSLKQLYCHNLSRFIVRYSTNQPTSDAVSNKFPCLDLRQFTNKLVFIFQYRTCFTLCKKAFYFCWRKHFLVTNNICWSSFKFFVVHRLEKSANITIFQPRGGDTFLRPVETELGKKDPYCECFVLLLLTLKVV